jgi:hypothetical protein
MSSRIIATALLVFLVIPSVTFAQRFSASGHFASSRWSEFEGSDNGFGGRFTWMPSETIGVDADITWYPSDFQPEGASFSRQRVEGLFGATIGPRLNGVRPFAKASAGFLKVSPTSGAFACITIFPPPLACILAGGDTLPAFEIGGGIEADAGSRYFFRGDISDRILRYPGPTFDSNFEIRDEGFLGHALRITLGAGVKF